jgi:hypothetical protein
MCIQHVSFLEGHGNIIVEYPGTDPEAGVVSFVGAHMVRVRSVFITKRPRGAQPTPC